MPLTERNSIKMNLSSFPGNSSSPLLPLSRRGAQPRSSPFEEGPGENSPLFLFYPTFFPQEFLLGESFSAGDPLPSEMTTFVVYRFLPFLGNGNLFSLSFFFSRHCSHFPLNMSAVDTFPLPRSSLLRPGRTAEPPGVHFLELCGSTFIIENNLSTCTAHPSRRRRMGRLF